MSVEPVDNAADAERDGETDGRYAELDVENALIIYDRDNHRAWLQSDGAVAVATMQ